MKNTIILILSLLVIGLGSYVIFDKVISKETKNINTLEVVENTNTESKNASEVRYKIVKDWKNNTDENSCSGEYNETYNNINVKISYSGCTFDDFKNELRVNGDIVKLELPTLGDFAFLGKYLIFELSSTSSIQLKIYDTSSKNFVYTDVTDYHLLSNWNIESNNLYFTGKFSKDMFPLQPYPGYESAKFEFTYENDKLSEPVIVEKWN